MFTNTNTMYTCVGALVQYVPPTQSENAKSMNKDRDT